MKLNIANPISGTQKCVEIDDDKKYSVFFDHRMGHEVEISQLGDDFKGYIVKITGGNDKDGFSMKQGVIVKGRVRLLMSKGHKTYRPRRKGERKRKSVRGCIVGPDIAVLSLVVVKKGEKEIPGLTDDTKPRRLGPKRVNKIKKLFAMTKKDSIALVKKNIVRRTVKNANTGKEHVKAPRIQRLVTDIRLRRKKQYRDSKKSRWRTSIEARQNYIKMLQNLKKQKEKKEATKTEEKKEEKKPDSKKVEKKPAEKKPAEKKPTDKKPAEKKPTEKKKADEPKKETKKEKKAGKK